VSLTIAVAKGSTNSIRRRSARTGRKKKKREWGMTRTAEGRAGRKKKKRKRARRPTPVALFSLSNPSSVRSPPEERWILMEMKGKERKGGTRVSCFTCLLLLITTSQTKRKGEKLKTVEGIEKEKRKRGRLRLIRVNILNGLVSVCRQGTKWKVCSMGSTEGREKKKKGLAGSGALSSNLFPYFLARFIGRRRKRQGEKKTTEAIPGEGHGKRAKKRRDEQRYIALFYHLFFFQRPDRRPRRGGRGKKGGVRRIAKTSQ